MRDAMPLTSSLPGSTEVGVAGKDNPGHSRHAVRATLPAGRGVTLRDTHLCHSLSMPPPARRLRTAKS